MHEVAGLGGINANLSPDAFHRWATHYYKCKQDFKSPHVFSPVPYFLLCRAIELELKSRYLGQKTQAQIKSKYGHDLKKPYDDLNQTEKILTPSEESILLAANKIYSNKGFEYFDPEDSLTGYSRYPNLEILDLVAKKLIGFSL